MIATGYPGEIAAAGSNASMIWWVISMVFFVYILWTLFAGEVGQALKGQSGEIGKKASFLLMGAAVLSLLLPGRRATGPAQAGAGDGALPAGPDRRTAHV